MSAGKDSSLSALVISVVLPISLVLLHLRAAVDGVHKVPRKRYVTDDTHCIPVACTY